MRTALTEIAGFWSYLLGKRSEVQALSARDVLLAKVILDIHRKRTRTEFVFVPLFAVRQIHPIDREDALQATAQRAATVEAHKAEILNHKRVSREILAAYLPSVSWIKVVQQDPQTYIAYEGNGRLAALQKVFRPEDGLLLEVEQYFFRNPAKILRRMNRVRGVYGLLQLL